MGDNTFSNIYTWGEVRECQHMDKSARPGERKNEYGGNASHALFFYQISFNLHPGVAFLVLSPCLWDKGLLDRDKKDTKKSGQDSVM